MRERRGDLSWIMLAILLLACLNIQGGVGIVKASPGTPKIYVDPPISTGQPGENFTIDVKVAEIVIAPQCKGLYAWGFWLEFNPAILQVASHIEEQSIIDSWIGDGANVTFATTKKPVVPGSETVYVNFTLVDYTIDYETGEITFTTAPGVGADIRAFYSYYVTVYHVTSGQFLEETGWDTAWSEGFVAPDVDNDNGLIGAGDQILPDPTFPLEGATGDGTLATITFQVIAEGASPLHLADTDLGTVLGEPPFQYDYPIEPHDRFDGFFEYPPKLHDIGVTHITASPTTVPVGETVSINATVKNEGEAAENFEVKAFYNWTYPAWSEIDTITVTGLAPEDSEKVSFSWKPHGIYKGTFIIKVEVPPIPGETDKTDNTKEFEKVFVGEAPTASFKISPAPPYYVGDNLTFNASASEDPDGTIVSYQWDFGDDNITTAADPVITHIYTALGNYTVTLTVTDDDGLTDIATTNMTISWVRDVAVTNLMVSSNTVKIGEPVYINVTVANKGNYPEPENFTVRVHYDNKPLPFFYVKNLASLTETTLDYTWDTKGVAAGEYTIKANATLDGDVNPGNNVKVFDVTVLLSSSTISISASPTSMTLGGSTTITGSIAPERTEVTVTIQHRPAGGSWSGLTTVTTGGDSQYSYVWTPTTPGTYEFKASWEGDDLALADESDVITIEVVAIATPPVAIFTPSTTSAYVGDSITFNASASYDEDGNIDSWDWDFDDDGNIDATGEIVEHAYSSAGTYTVVLTVTDDEGLTDIATDTVTIKVQEAPALGILPYVAAAAVATIIVIAIAFYFLRARKQGVKDMLETEKSSKMVNRMRTERFINLVCHYLK